MNILFDEISAELQTHYFAFAKFWERAGFVFDDKAKSISLTTDKVTKEILNFGMIHLFKRKFLLFVMKQHTLSMGIIGEF